MDKDCASDDDVFDFAAVAVAIYVGLLLACDVCFVALFEKLHAARSLVVARDDGYKPLAVWHASGTRLAHLVANRCATIWLCLVFCHLLILE